MDATSHGSGGSWANCRSLSTTQTSTLALGHHVTPRSRTARYVLGHAAVLCTVSQHRHTPKGTSTLARLGDVPMLWTYCGRGSSQGWIVVHQTSGTDLDLLLCVLHRCG